MSKKNKSDRHGIVYSTDPSFHFEQEQNDIETFTPAQQKLKIRLDTKHRAGKAVTLVEGFRGRDEDLQELGKKLKSFCGTGGSAKDGEIIIQGDQREKVTAWLKQNGYSGTKAWNNYNPGPFGRQGYYEGQLLRTLAEIFYGFSFANTSPAADVCTRP